jgi:hypothetical protein
MLAGIIIYLVLAGGMPKYQNDNFSCVSWNDNFSHVSWNNYLSRVSWRNALISK